MIDPILRDKFKDFMSDDPYSPHKANILFFINRLDNDWSELQYQCALDHHITDDPLFRQELNRLKLKHGVMTPAPTKEDNTQPIVIEVTTWDCIKLIIKNKIKKLLGE